MKKTYYLFFIFIFISCSKEQVTIDVFQTTKTSETVVIDGFVTTYYGDQFIKISKSTGLVADQTNPVLDAEVSVYSNDSLYQFELYDSLGNYCSVKPFAIERGVKYTCKIIVDGEEYLASDSLALINENEADSLLLPSDTTNQRDNISLQFYFINYGYESTSMYSLGMSYYTYDGDSYKNLNVGNYLFNKRSTFIFNIEGSLPQGVYANSSLVTRYNIYEGSYFEYFYLNISNTYADFLIDYFNITEWSGGIFSTIPGNALTNVSNGGLGYFFLADVKRIQIDYNDYIELLE